MKGTFVYCCRKYWDYKLQTFQPSSTSVRFSHLFGFHLPGFRLPSFRLLTFRFLWSQFHSNVVSTKFHREDLFYLGENLRLRNSIARFIGGNNSWLLIDPSCQVFLRHLSLRAGGTHSHTDIVRNLGGRSNIVFTVDFI